jgi:transposase
LFPSELLAAPAGSGPFRCVRDDDLVTISIAMAAPTAPCPRCGHDARRVYSHYTRRFADLPCFGIPVRLELTVRRFRCLSPECPRRIFAERLNGFAAKHARTTNRLRRSHEAVGYALGGEAGSRLAAFIAMPTSPDTLLRRIKQLKDVPGPLPRLVGIDDWAWRKGQRYGTIVVDLETSEIIDLLPDRDAATVKVWLAAHPGVELVSRDRASSYSQAATEAASQSQQVADRWHLLKNVREAIERVLDRHLLIITEALKPSDLDPGKAEPSQADEPSLALDPVAEETSSNSPRKEAALAKRRRRVGQFQQVQELHRQGTPIREIARDLAMSRKSVRRFLGHEKCPESTPRRRRRSGMDLHREWVDARIAEGKINASELHRELAARGVRLSYATVRRSLTNRLGRAGKSRARVNAAKPKPLRPPSPRQLSFDWVRRPEKRMVESQARLEKIRAASPDLTTALDLADEFKSLIRKQSSGTLRDWLTRAEASPCPEVRHFAEGIRRDESAVNAAITLPWSNGPVEGHVNRLKTIKRQMYGRAGFVLLRARVLKAA